MSGGLAHGVVHVLKDQFDEPEPETIRPEQADHEMERLRKALAVTRGEIEGLQRQMVVDGGEAEADIFDAHLLILDDVTLLKQVERRVRVRAQRTRSGSTPAPGPATPLAPRRGRSRLPPRPALRRSA